MNCQAPPSQAWKCHVNGSPPKADQDDIEAPRTAEVSPAIHFKLCIHAEDVVSFLIADSAPPRPGEGTGGWRGQARRGEPVGHRRKPGGGSRRCSSRRAAPARSAPNLSIGLRPRRARAGHVGPAPQAEIDLRRLAGYQSELGLECFGDLLTQAAGAAGLAKRSRSCSASWTKPMPTADKRQLISRRVPGAGAEWEQKALSGGVRRGDPHPRQCR